MYKKKAIRVAIITCDSAFNVHHERAERGTGEACPFGVKKWEELLERYPERKLNTNGTHHRC